MNMKGIFTGKLRSDEHIVTVRVPIIQFEEDNNQIIYCPALEVTGYGNSEDEAKEAFEISLSEFFKYTLHKRTLYNEMRRLGWKVKKSMSKAHPPSMSKLLEENDNFNRIFNQYAFRKYDEQIEIPV